MEVPVTPDMEQRLSDLATRSGRPVSELVQEAIARMVNELAETREMLDRRYDDIESGRVRLIDGEEAFARLMAKTEAERKRPA